MEYVNEHKIIVNVGERLNWKDIPISKNIDTSNLNLNYDYLKNGFALNVGNPHLVFFVDTLDLKKLKKDSEKKKKFSFFRRCKYFNC